MRAILVDEPGGPDVLVWGTASDPACGSGDVVLDVVATAVNRADLLQRQGYYPPPAGVSELLGLECSGIVREVGADVSGWRVGDEACALLAGGGYAERVAVPAGQLLPVPAGVDLVTAAALPEVLCTAWLNLVMVAGLRAGEVLLVHGGGSGVGTAAIQIGAALGARVAATAGSEDKLGRCAELGASILVNYRQSDFVTEVRDATDGQGADVILDIVGAKYLARNIAALAEFGRLVVIGLQGGRRAELDINVLMDKRASVTATRIRDRPVEQKAAIVAEARKNVWPLLESGAIVPVVDRLFPLSEAAEAHRVVEAGDHVGKVLLVT